MLSFHLEPGSGTPLYNQIYEQIRARILQGELPTAAKLPSTRSLAANLGVSRNTIDTAYYQLQSEGYIDSAPKSGFYVCDITPTDYRHQPELPFVASPPSRDINISSSAPADASPEYLYDFDPYSIDISHFPFSVWRRLSRQVLTEEPSLFLLGDNDGDSPLRDAVCSYVRISRQVSCTPDQIIVGAGVDYLLQMLSLVFRSLHMDHITLESPGYTQAAHIFHNNGLAISPGTLDKNGLTTDSISPLSSLVYVTPSHQFPMGTVMPYGRRMELLGWAKSSPDRYIIEDDHDSEFRYRGKPIPAMQGLDSRRVIYIGTFSKAITPAIRVGYMILPPDLLEQYRLICGHYSCTVSRVDQAILTHFIREGYFEKHVNRMRKLYRNKHDLVLDCLQPLIQKYHLKLQGEHAGMHVTICLPDNISETKLIENARCYGIHLYGIRDHYLPDHIPAHPEEAILLGYAGLTEDEIKKGIHQLMDTHIFSAFALSRDI